MTLIVSRRYPIWPAIATLRTQKYGYITMYCIIVLIFRINTLTLFFEYWATPGHGNGHGWTYNLSQLDVGEEPIK